MADSKITALTALTAADPVNDMFPIVDVSDTTMAASGTTKKISVNNILGASGTATLASATITGDLTVDTSTLKVDSTNNRVGIGLASGMTAPLEVQSNTSGTGINIRGRADNSGALRFFANDGTTQQAYISGDDSNIDIVSASTRPIRFIVNGTVVASVLNGGNVSIANGNLVMSTSGKGIDFSATTSGSGTMTSELLNDYEEGTWTIGLKFGGASVGLTTSANTGRYTKVGRQVNVTGYIQLTNKGTSVGAAAITGLPFGVANNAESYAPTTLRLNGVSYTGAVQAYAANTSPTISLEQLSILGAITDITDSNFTNASAVMFNVTYTVA
jgi:hypothetical protein